MKSWLERDWLMLLDFDPDVVGCRPAVLAVVDHPGGQTMLTRTDYFGYQRSSLRSDVIAGRTVWAVLVPESLAYATIAGVCPGGGLLQRRRASLSCAGCPSVVDPRPLTEPGDLGRPAAR